MRYPAKHVKKFQPKFEMPPERTPGDIWHEEVEREGFLRTLAVALLGLVVAVFIAAYVAPEYAHASLEPQSITAMSATGKDKVMKKAVVSYSKWKSFMTKDQRDRCKVLVERMMDTDSTTKAEHYKRVFDKYVKRAKLCKKIDARGYSNKKVNYVSKWGKRLNKYLKGSAMRGTGYVIAQASYDTKMDPRLYAAISKVESGKGAQPYQCKYNVCGWVWGNPAMYSWEDAAYKWHRYFKKFFKKERYPISSMHGYGSYGPYLVNVEMAKI